jgi:hypothetical protein
VLDHADVSTTQAIRGVPRTTGAKRVAVSVHGSWVVAISPALVTGTLAAIVSAVAVRAAVYAERLVVRVAGAVSVTCLSVPWTRGREDRRSTRVRKVS